MDPKKLLHKKQQELEEREFWLSQKEEDFYSSDRRFEKLFVLSGLLVCLWSGAVVGSSHNELDPKITAILFGALGLQVFIGMFLALLLLRKHYLGKGYYYSGLLLHVAGGVLWTWVFLGRISLS